jgi:hypothetical protein
MKSEGAFLIYPIGDIDEDPETLIRFVGMHPEPVAAAGRRGYYRALVTIELFQLDNAVTRKELFKARARLIRLLFKELETLNSRQSLSRQRDAREWISILLGSREPHANCLRSFHEVYLRDSAMARALVDDARSFLEGGSFPSHPSSPLI